ncbi:MAG: hypothetical protein WD231_02330 [Candidatus Woykebacteria bacterium]
MNEVYISGIQFNTREIAVFVWLAIFFVWAIQKKEIRNSLQDLVKTFSKWKILTPIVAAIFYSMLIVFFLHKLDIWGTFLIRDTVYWFLGTAFVLLLNSNEATRGAGFFRKILRDNLKVIIVIEFIVNLYTLNFFIELFLVPALFFVVAMNALAQTKAEYAKVKKVLDYLLSGVGVFFILFAFINIVGNYQGFISSENLKTLVMPPILTTAFIPFLYFFALLMAYEMFYLRLGFFIKNNPTLLRFAKIKFFQLCHFNLSKLNRFAKESSQDLMKLSSEADVLQIVERFK